ncbi:unnamed protein product [Discosporangium mesarthrocarpum]
MGKKGGSGGINTKVAAAQERQANLAAARAGKAAAEAEAEEAGRWAKGANTRGSSREEDAARKQAEKAAKAAQKKALEAAEESELKSIKTVTKKKSKTKDIPPWEAALVSSAVSKKDQKRAEAARRQAEAEELRKERAAKAEAEAKALRDAGIVMMDSEAPMEVNPNPNRTGGEDDFAWASGIDAAMDVLSMADNLGEGVGSDRHPEKRLKAAYMAFEEEELPQLQEDKPGMKLRQYKQLIFEKWKRSPQNPVNQARAAEAAAAAKAVQG